MMVNARSDYTRRTIPDVTLQSASAGQRELPGELPGERRGRAAYAGGAGDAVGSVMSGGVRRLVRRLVRRARMACFLLLVE